MNSTKGKNYILNYLKGTATQKQADRLETWYLLEAEKAAKNKLDIGDIDMVGEKMWRNIEPALSLPDAPVIVPLKSRFKRYRFAIAASLFFICGVAVYFLNIDPSPAKRFELAGAKDISAGGNKAILTLSDGRKIDLTRIDNGVLSTQGGSQVFKAGNGLLTYQPTGSRSAGSLFNTIQTPRGGQFMVTLPDGSRVWLNSESSLRFPTDFSGPERKVYLNGEAYFEIAHQQNASNHSLKPFIVAVSNNNDLNQEVKVLGTHFNINAYRNESEVLTTLLQGKVIVSASGKTLSLSPGQQSLFRDRIFIASNVDTSTAVSWKNGEFVFRENLEHAMRKIERWYDVEVVYDSSAPKTLQLGGWISRENNISDILNHIQATGKVHFKLIGRRVLVSE